MAGKGDINFKICCLVAETKDMESMYFSRQTSARYKVRPKFL